MAQLSRVFGALSKELELCIPSCNSGYSRSDSFYKTHGHLCISGTHSHRYTHIHKNKMIKSLLKRENGTRYSRVELVYSPSFSPDRSEQIEYEILH